MNHEIPAGTGMTVKQVILFIRLPHNLSVSSLNKTMNDFFVQVSPVN